MMTTISRKQEFAILARDKKTDLFDEKDMQSLNPRMYNLIGKDVIL